MEWHEGRPRLKLTGHRSAAAVEDIFASSMVDVAYVVEATSEAVLVVADDAAWPADREDYDWLCSIIRQTLAAYGIKGIEMAFVPGAGPALSA
jgi:hypothetical protein